MLLKLEQKPVKWMIELVSKFSKVEEQLMDTCPKTLTTAEASLQLSGHLRHFGCEKESSCFQDALPPLVELYANPALNPNSDITGSEVAAEARKVFVKVMVALASNIWLIAGLCRPNLLLCRHPLFM